jgi:hypothetical protein
VTDEPAATPPTAASFFYVHSVPWITAQSGPCRHSGSQEGASMRAYLTVAGMALGLVALWAALVPLLA